MTKLSKLLTKAISIFSSSQKVEVKPKPTYSLSKILILIDRNQHDLKALTKISDFILSEYQSYPRIQYVLIMKTINSKLSNADQGYENDSNLVLA